MHHTIVVKQWVTSSFEKCAPLSVSIPIEWHKTLWKYMVWNVTSLLKEGPVIITLNLHEMVEDTRRRWKINWWPTSSSLHNPTSQFQEYYLEFLNSTLKTSKTVFMQKNINKSFADSKQRKMRNWSRWCIYRIYQDGWTRPDMLDSQTLRYGVKKVIRDLWQHLVRCE